MLEYRDVGISSDPNIELTPKNDGKQVHFNFLNGSMFCTIERCLCEFKIRLISFQIKVSLSDHLLPGLTSSPSDIEALRIYLILPEIVIYEGTKDAYQDMWFITSLGEQIMKLRDEAKRVLCEFCFYTFIVCSVCSLEIVILVRYFRGNFSI